MTRPGQLWPPDDRPDLGAYTVAFSFAGERIDDGNVRKIAEAVELALLPGEVFFDEFFEPRVRQGPTRAKLDDIYRNRSALAVRFLCEDYRGKRWPQGESIAITSRDPGSILDLQATEVAIDGLAGAQSFPFKSHKEPEKCVEQILYLARQIVARPSNNKNEIRPKINVFQALTLIEKLGAVTIGEELLYAAVRKANLTWPFQESPRHYELSWWINECRDHKIRLTKLLHGIWPAIESCEQAINIWYRRVFGSAFIAPKAVKSSIPVMQITRENLGPKSDSRMLLNFDLVRESDRQNSGVLECKAAELPDVFRREFRKLEQLAQSRESRVELVLPLSDLHGEMQSAQIQYGEFRKSLCLCFPTVVRSHQREQFNAPTHQHWQTQGSQNLELHFCGCPDKERWGAGLPRAKVWVFDTMHCIPANRISLLNELVLSAVPIAIWYKNADCNVTPALMLNRASLPEQILEHRISHYQMNPSSDVVLLYEDPNVPVRTASELENDELEAQT